jgi:hypothetical protein
MGFKRRDRRFFPSADIRSVCREGGAVRVELQDAPEGKQSFKFWPADLRAAVTIVALLPTANTVEIDAPASIETEPPARRISPAVWVLTVAATVIAALVAASVAFLRQGEASLQASASDAATAPPETAPLRAAPPAVTDAEAELAREEFERVEPQIEGLKLQLVTAIRALETGAVSQGDFSTGLENWLVPQWRMLGNELANRTPQPNSARSGMHEDLAASVAAWQGAMQSYAQGLRERDNDQNVAAFAQMKRAEELEQQARHRLASLETRNGDAGGDAPPR